jgi:hypothetical protein
MALDADHVLVDGRSQ